jgi:CxxC motif-containing protein (DUF1111 family)
MSARRLIVALLGLTALVEMLLSARAILAQTAPGFGEPLADLPPSLRAAFDEGRQRFAIEETPATGLGPLFNARSCAACHAVPALAGSAARGDAFTVRFGRRTPGQPFDPLLNLGGPTQERRSVAPELEGCHLAGEVVPREANALGVRQPPPLFGLGLIQAIPESTILARADPDDADGDGIAGRANASHGVIGRFGWKAAVATVADFVGLSLIGQLGITNFLYSYELAPQGAAIPAACKIAADMEDFDASRLAGITAFLSFMTAPPRGPITEAGRRGETLFAQVGCASCHTPVMKTGASSIAGVSDVDVSLYSDLLTHDMGADLDDGITEGGADGRRWRTPPLWGLRARRFYLHDGRTADLARAIALHGGEAGRSRDHFAALSAAQQADLLAFLRSL